MRAQDTRIDEAKAKPVSEVLAILQIYNLRHTPNRREMCGPCPQCGEAGHDPKTGPSDRFNINLLSGAFFCRKCDIRGGDQIALVQTVEGCSFLEALTFLCGEQPKEETSEQRLAREKRQSDARARAEADQKRQQTYAEKQRRKARSDARIIWKNTVSGASARPLMSYLSGRGLGAIYGKGFPAELRFLANHPYVRSINKQLVTLHRGPCMIARVSDSNGAGTAVHQTWIDPKQAGKKAAIWHAEKEMPAKMVRGSQKGCAIRLVTPPHARTLVVGEGIETTLTAFCADAVPGAAYWAGINLGNMAGRMLKVSGKRWSGLPDMSDSEAFVPPPWCEHLIYIMDGDSGLSATRAKLEAGLARAARLRPGLRKTIVFAGNGVDLNDVLMGAEG
ncbi:DUF7146 domain-containing protein [Shimia sp.]|uniref:DUF7146 domain-containing protein n=1 Tax=Shimia sp. TaxID=1954381 RepID=UPI003B8DEE3B